MCAFINWLQIKCAFALQRQHAHTHTHEHIIGVAHKPLSHGQCLTGSAHTARQCHHSIHSQSKAIARVLRNMWRCTVCTQVCIHLVSSCNERQSDTRILYRRRCECVAAIAIFLFLEMKVSTILSSNWNPQLDNWTMGHMAREMKNQNSHLNSKQ